LAWVNGIYYVIAGLALALGVFIFRWPEKTFAIQKRFYSLINWNIEPISLPKEIRNTKIMGLILLIFVVGSCCYRLNPSRQQNTTPAKTLMDGLGSLQLFNKAKRAQVPHTIPAVLGGMESTRI
jgi:hypothetical protein